MLNFYLYIKQFYSVKSMLIKFITKNSLLNFQFVKHALTQMKIIRRILFKNKYIMMVLFFFFFFYRKFENSKINLQ